MASSASPQTRPADLSRTETATSHISKTPSRSFLDTPPFITRLFARFPLRTLEPNRLPERTRAAVLRRQNVLFVHPPPRHLAPASDHERPDRLDRRKPVSCDSDCLYAQTLLMFDSEPTAFAVAPISHHAAPENTLPCLVPASTASTTADLATMALALPPRSIPAEKILDWSQRRKAQASQKVKDSSEMDTSSESDPTSKIDETDDKTYHAAKLETSRLDAYTSLVQRKIRPAFLYARYVATDPSRPTDASLSESSSYVVQRAAVFAQSVQAKQEIKATQPPVWRQVLEWASARQRAEKHQKEVSELYSSAAQAFDDLATRLDSEEWFFGKAQPGQMDALVFAHVHWLVEAFPDEEACDQRSDGHALPGLRAHVLNNKRLMDHRQRILGTYFV